MCVRGGFFSRAVSVTVEPGEEGELQVVMMMMVMMMMMMMMMKTIIMMMMMIRDNVDELQWERKAAADGVRFPVNDHTTGRGGDIYSLHTTPHPCRQRGRVLHAPVPRQHSEGGRPSLLREPGDGREPHRPLHVLLVSTMNI